MSILRKSIVPHQLTLWLEDGKLNYKEGDLLFSMQNIDFIKDNSGFLKELIINRSQKSIKIFPLASNQTALWLHSQINPQNISYNVAISGRIKNPLNKEILKEALIKLTERRMLLRSVFLGVRGEKTNIIQVVLDQFKPFIEETDASKLTKTQLNKLIYDKYRIPFNLENGPLLKTYIFHTDDSAYFLFNIHHIICDAWSLKIFIKELFEYYNAFLNGVAPALEPISYDYSNYVLDQEKYMEGPEGERKLNFWRERLEGKISPLILPYDFKRPALQTFNGATYHFVIKDDLFLKLNEVAKKVNATPNLILFTLYELLLSKLSNQKQFIIGTPSSSRTTEAHNNVFGYLINMLPIDCSLDDRKKFSDYVQENKSKFVSLTGNQEIPFPVIVESISPKRDPSMPLVFQVIYNFMNRRTIGSLMDLWKPAMNKYKKFGSLNISSYPINHQEGQFDLTFEILHDLNEFNGVLKYNTDLFKSDTIKGFIDEYMTLLNSVISDPDYIPEWIVNKNTEVKSPKISVKATGTFTIEPISPYLSFWMDKADLNAEIEFPGYNQVFQQLLNPASEFNTNKEGFNLSLIRLEDVVKTHINENDIASIKNKIKELSDAITFASDINPKGKYIIAFCPGSDSLRQQTAISNLIDDLEDEIIKNSSDRGNLFFIPSGKTISTYSVTDYYEQLGEENGHIPYKDDFFISLATLFVRKIRAFFMLPVKAIAVDCDNTLWKGVVGEEGWNGIKIGEAELAIQRFLIEQYSEGVLICLCSKNNEEDVFEVFEKNTDMLLKREHIAFTRINWLPKSQNIISLSEEINIGPDTFVFIDDNSSECAEMTQQLPQVITIQKPDNDLNADFLRNSWVFDKLRITEEDKVRSRRYRDESERKKYRSAFDDYKDFIDGLQLTTEIAKFNEDEIPRISQLTFRTNQFNFTTRRRSEIEISELKNNKDFDCFQVKLTDRFGDYGLTGVIIADKRNAYAIDTMLLSCRVLGKGVEHKLISYLGEKALESHAENLKIQLIKTAKNTPAQMFLDQNFRKYQKTEGDSTIYNIPVSEAVNFTFSPALVNEDEIPQETKKDISTPAGLDFGKRNSFFKSVIENYLKPGNIRKEIRAKSSVKSDTLKVSEGRLSGQTISAIRDVWKDALNRDSIGLNDNFFEIGGHSVLIPRIVIDLETKHDIKIKIVDVFQYPTVQELANFIDRDSASLRAEMSQFQNENEIRSNDVAIIGIAGRFPGADNIDEFWEMIKSGREGLSFYTREELESKNVDQSLLDNKNYVYANGVLASADKFDSAFFGYAPREADFMDPQHRIFLEVCYEALENAGYRNEKNEYSIGVFGGTGMNNYLVKNLLQHPGALSSFGEFQTILSNSSDHLTTKVSYKLNLKGPSMDVQTACSTSMVAVHVACRSLLNNECNIALGGGSFIPIPYNEGYVYEQGGIFSPDGHCRPFDKSSNGTLFGSGAGVVVLKRLKDALVDNDNILAVIKGTAINNDGSQKVGYMAPSVQGQSDVILKALHKSGINPETITYLEAHGTGTRMGDPIEVSALTQAYRKFTSKENYCAIGSVKGNIGHLDAASGISGLIKTVLLLKNKKLPPLTNFKELNPELYLENSPFYVNEKLTDWVTEDNTPRRAGVSSFGMGGTNVHCILEEAPEVKKTVSEKRFHLLPLSGKSPKSLKKQKENFLDYLRKSRHDIGDIAYTLQQGRDSFAHRSVIISETRDDAIRTIESLSDRKVNGSASLSNPKIVFMFTGQGSQYVGMARDLYNNFELFRDLIEKAQNILSDYDVDVLKFILSENDESLREKLDQTAVTQPLLFAVQYSTAKLLGEFGVFPDALIGHSIGELTAACISGVFSYEDGLKIVAERGRIMQAQQPGAMLSIQLPAESLKQFLVDETEISLYNAPSFTVVSGTFEGIDNMAKILKDEHPEVFLTRLKTSHAFHSALIEPAAEKFTNILASVKFNEPSIPVISNSTGTWATKEDLQNPSYWGKHIRTAVNFKDGINELLKDDNIWIFEVGPGNSLSTLVSLFPGAHTNKMTTTLRHPKEKLNDAEVFLKSVAKAWTSGVTIDWDFYYLDEKRSRIPLPNYPFERTRHWISPNRAFAGQVNLATHEIISDHDDVEIKADEPQILFHDRPSIDNEFVAAETAIEKKVASIWEELLGIRGIGIKDDFFLLGGHSLLASQIINRINEECKTKITLEKLFNTPTISGLVENETFTEVVEIVPDIQVKLNYSASIPLSPSQERLWIVNQIDNNNPEYNIPFSYILHGKLDIPVFQNAIDLLFARHKILKSHINDELGRPMAYINKGDRILISQNDFSDSSEKELDDRVQEFLEHESRMSFDIQNGPLYRLHLIKLGEDKTLFHFTIHHLIFDGWSWGVFTKELKVIYDDFLAGKASISDHLSFDYFEYSVMVLKEDPEKLHKESADYWREKLSGITGHLNFPLDFKRKEVSSGLGGRVALDLGKLKSEQLRTITKQENVTLYMFLLSAFGVLLNRYTGDKDICIGSPTANRPNSKFEKIIGLFINSVVMRIQVDEELSFSKLLKEVKKISIEALSHQDLPFESLVQILNPDRVVNMNPVFQVMFALQNAPRPPLDLTGIRSERVFQKNGVSPLDISFYAWEENGSILGEIEFSSDIFKRSTIESLKENFIYLLNNIIEDPGRILKDLSVTSGHDKRQLEQFNSTDALFPEFPIPVLVEKSVKEFQGKIAVESGSGSLSYKDMNSRANQFAHYLRDKGFGPGMVAGISMKRSSSMIVALLGILKAGGTYLPLDPSFPDDRLIYMLEDSGAGYLVTEKSLLDKFSNINIKKVVFDSEQIEIQNLSNKNPDVKIDMNSVAYMIYTSGSTGKPKGVKVHHLAVASFLNSMAKVPGLTSDDKLLAVTTLSFDISILEVFLPLTQGASIYIAESGHIIDGEALARIISRNRISVLQATPATWALLIGSGWKGNSKLKALCGGEALQANLSKELLSRVGSLWNMYGPTETTVWSTCQPITDSDQILVGKPIDNTKVHILHNNLEQPVGIIGEVCISGLGVSKGYHNRAELNKEKFINLNGTLMYRTGDLGRFLSNGNIELLGRTDNQIKHRGYRIEPGEIEFQLSQIEGVKEAVVKLEKLEEQDERLIGYLNVLDSFSLNREQIVSSIENRLPNYMIPSSFMIMKEFPRTLNGKINRKALIYNIANQPEEKEDVKEDFTPVEKSIAAIWENILKMKNIKKHQNFFDIGGNSLLALRIINKIKEDMGIILTFREMITDSTISKLADLVEKEVLKSGKGIDLVHTTEKTNLPLTINQKRLWLVSKLHPDIASYIIPYTYYLNGQLDLKLFKKSLDLLFLKHNILFSVIKENKGEPYCDISSSDVKLSVIDYSGVSEREKAKKLEEILSVDSMKAFDLNEGPLYHLYLIVTGTHEYYFHISVHHIIFDGWSWSVFAKDLNSIYNSLIAGNEVAPDETEFQQYDYALWENNSADPIRDEELIGFWKETLSGASPLINFPYDFPRKEQPSGIGRYETISFSEDVTDKLRRISRNEGVSLFTTLLSGYSIQLQKYTGDDDINIGIPVAFRPHSKLEDIIGMFVNTVAVRLNYPKEFSFRDIVRHADKAALDAISHQDLTFENVVEIVNPDRSSNANPLFQVAFVWQNNLDQPIELSGIRSKHIPPEIRTTPFDITLYFWENDNKIEGEIEYAVDLLNHDTIVKFKDNFLRLITNLVNNPDTVVRSIPLVSEEEKAVIESFNDVKTDYPDNKTIAQLFEEQVELFPGKTAVVFKEDSLTYKQLNERSNQLARVLREAGVRDNMPVGLLSEKSLDLIVGMLGILKAGGAYVPVDTEYPEQRVSYIITDSGCRIILAQEKYMKQVVDGVKMININSPDYFSQEKSNIEQTISSSGLAYIMYTSGTTGKPKGSMIPQKGVVRLVRNINYMELTSSDRILLTGAIVFDASTYEIWGALLNGATLYVVEKETFLNPTTLGEELDKNDITILWLTSALFTNIAEVRSDIFGKLKYLLSGGDVLSIPHINKVRKVNPGLKVLNCYGPTENTTFSTTFLIDKDFSSNIPIGKPISNSTTYIFDKNMNYQPVGIIGELFVGGDGLSLGYLNRDDLNKTSFMDHPFKQGEKIYKTGDYARWLPDGNIEFHGRIDNQLKIRGFRVELGEIESVLSEIEGVIEVVIKPVKVQEGDKRLVAFLSVSDTFNIDVRDLGVRIKEKLPPYMIPSAFKIMHGFPQNVNGKTDKAALHFDINDLVIKESQDVKSFSPTEEIIYNIWSEALRTKDISATDNFFDIGGNSLLAISVFSKIESSFNLNLGLRVFFDSPRIKDLAEVLDIKIQNSVLTKSTVKSGEKSQKIIEGEI